MCTTAFLVSIQASVEWAQRGIATSVTMFMRIAGQAVGAAVFGAVVNYGLGDAGPDSIDRLMEPAMRAELDAADLSALTDLLAADHDVKFTKIGTIFFPELFCSDQNRL